MSLKKDAYYFPHFSNARNDRKIRRIRKELGPEGYGIYFMLLEVLREQTNFSYPMSDIDLLADELGSSEQKVRTVIANYQLFQVDEAQNFFSANLLKYLEPYFRMKEQRRLAGIESGKARHNKQLEYGTTVERPLNGGEQTRVKKRKEKKSKVKETHEKTGRPISITRYTNLTHDYGQDTVDRYIQKIADYCDTHDKEYKDYAAAAANWIQRDIEAGKFTAAREAIGKPIQKLEKQEN